MINQDLKQSENEERGKRSASMVNEEKVYDKAPETLLAVVVCMNVIVILATAIGALVRVSV